MTITKSVLAVALVFLCFTATEVLAQDDWHHGIGTGLFALNVEGDTAFTTALGPVEFESDLDASDIADVLGSAIGIGGFSTKGPWTLTYAFQQLELEDGVSGNLRTGTPASAEASFEATVAELAVTYQFAQTGNHYWGALLGARYIDHEYGFEGAIGPLSLNREINEDWTDVLVGFTHTFPFSETLAWTSRVDYGFGGSEGTLTLNTGLQWQISERFAANLFGQHMAIEFENDDRGDADHYLYENDEFGIGINVLVTW